MPDAVRSWLVADGPAHSARRPWSRSTASAQHAKALPAHANSGRYAPVYLCTCLYIVDSDSNHQLSLVVRAGNAPNADSERKADLEGLIKNLPRISCSARQGRWSLVCLSLLLSISGEPDTPALARRAWQCPPLSELADAMFTARALIGIRAVQEFLRDVEEHRQVRFGELSGDHFLEHPPNRSASLSAEGCDLRWSGPRRPHGGTTTCSGRRRSCPSRSGRAGNSPRRNAGSARRRFACRPIAHRPR